jgi:flagellar basal body rod protein FlgC
MSTYPFRIPSGTVVYPEVSGAQALGTSNNPFGTIYAQNVIISGSEIVSPSGSYLPLAGGTLTGPLSFSSGNYINTDILAANPTYSEGRVFYDNTEHTLAYYNDSSNVTVNVGQEMLIRARNNTGSTLSNGVAVHINGALGNRPTVHAALANEAANQAFIGLVTDDILTGNDGYVTAGGIVHTVNAASIGVSGVSAGTQLYLSPSVSGNLTSTRPSSPNFVVPVGFVTRVSGPNIDILVAPAPPAELGYDGANSVLGVNAAGNGPEYKSISGTNNISIVHTTGNIMVSGSSTPTFTTVSAGVGNFTGLTGTTISGTTINGDVINGIGITGTLISGQNINFGFTLNGPNSQITNGSFAGTSLGTTSFQANGTASLVGVSGVILNAGANTAITLINGSGIVPQISGSQTIGTLAQPFLSGVFTNLTTSSSITAPIINANVVNSAGITGTTISGTNGIFQNLSVINTQFLNSLGVGIITGTTASFTNITGTTISGTNLFVQNIVAAGITGTTVSGNSLLGQTANIGVITSNVGNFTGLTGTTVSGNSGLFQTANIGVITSNVGNFTGLTGTTVSGNSGLFQTANIGVITSNVGNFTGLTGTTISGTSLRGQTAFIVGLSGTTISGSSLLGQTANIGVITSNVGNFTGLTGTTISGTSLRGQTAFIVGLSGTTISGSSLLGQTANVGVITSNVGNFTGLTGTTVSGTSGLYQTANIGVITSNVGNFTGLTGTTVSGTSGLYQTANIGVITSNVGNFTGLTGTTVSGTSGLYQTANIGVVTANVGNFTGLTGTTISGTTYIGDTTMLNFIIDGAGSVIASGSQGHIEIPYNASAISWDLTSNISGSLSVDVRRSTYATWTGSTFISGNQSIVGTEKPTITNGFKGQDTSLTTWSGINAGDILNFHVDQTPTLITRATLSIKLRKWS